jgi:hypothetical protein
MGCVERPAVQWVAIGANPVQALRFPIPALQKIPENKRAAEAAL